MLSSYEDKGSRGDSVRGRRKRQLRTRLDRCLKKGDARTAILDGRYMAINRLLEVREGSRFGSRIKNESRHWNLGS